MRVTKSVVFGLVSLVCTVNAAKLTGKPVLAKRQTAVTVTKDGCTAVCWDLSSLNLDEGSDCDVYCEGGFTISMPATSSSKSTSTSTVITTVTTSTKAAVHPRTVVSATNGDCTAVCWDLMPGTECDVQCSSEFKTKMPVPSKAARVANLEARENVQAHQVRDARLARKFGGLVARDDTVTVTVTSIPEYCTAGQQSSISTTVAGIPTILPAQVPQEAGGSAALSQASAAISAVEQALSPAASSALSEASASLSSVAFTAPISANATTASPAPTGSAPMVSATTTVPASTVSATTTATTATSTSSEISTSSETTTESTTTTGSAAVSESVIATFTSGPATGAASEYAVSTGIILSLLVALAANVAFLI